MNNYEDDCRQPGISMEALYLINGEGLDGGGTAELPIDELSGGWLNQALTVADAAAGYALAFLETEGTDEERRTAGRAVIRQTFYEREFGEEMGVQQAECIGETLLYRRGWLSEPDTPSVGVATEPTSLAPDARACVAQDGADG